MRAEALLLFAAALAFPACTRKAPPPPPGPFASVAEAVAGSPELSEFLRRGRAVKNVQVLISHGPYTAFAPVNEAFTAAAPGLDWERTFWHHFARGFHAPEELRDGERIELMDGKTLTIHARDGRFFADEAAILKIIRSGNGVVYIIDRQLTR